MSDLQFPPSSPVLDGPDREFDLFAKDGGRGRMEYPTPNPSSTVGRSSSPARHENDLEDEAAKVNMNVNALNALSVNVLNLIALNLNLGKTVTFARPHRASRTVSINRDFNILNPDALVVRVPLLEHKNHVVIGRSSKSCDFHFRSVDRYVSRLHVRIDYAADSMLFTCLGFNGFGMIVPRVCQVTRTDDGLYQLRETGKPLVAANMPKTIHLDYQHTEFHVARGERVEVPRFSNVLVQIRDHVLLVNPEDYDEEITDDEAEQRLSTPLTTAPAPNTPQKPPFRVIAEEPTPSRSKENVPPVEAPAEARESVRADKIVPKRAMTPLANRSTNLPSTPPAKRRAASEEPVPAKKQRAEYDADGKLIIDEQCIAALANVGEIENILINHLAFSRLSSTPASYLNTILAVVSQLSIHQLRAVLHKNECIGVIYRLGKDASGKPLEEEYYYIPENDNDPERFRLVSLIKGHGGLRSCRRTHKQYYWKKPAPIKK